MTFGDAPVKGEGMAVAYDEGAGPPEPRSGWFRRMVRALTAWAWSEEQEAKVLVHETRCTTVLYKLQLGMLEELFREKQAKIKRLQDAYKARVSPMYEDMRLENPIKDAESLAQSINVLATRADAYRERTGKQMRISDGTVLGVPGDRPNEPVGEP